MPERTETNRGLAAAILLGALLLAGLGAFWGFRKAGRPGGPPLREDLEELRRIDPRLVIARETGRIPPGVAGPRALAVGPDDRLYVAGETELAVLGNDGKPLSRRALGAPATAAAAAPDGTVYLGLKDRIEVFDADGNRKAAWERPDPKTWITSIAAAADAVYAADFGRRAVLRYDPSGRLLGEIPGFNIPSPCFDVAVDPAGSLWVANTALHRLENRRPDGSRAASWGEESARIGGFSGCCNPSHFAIRRDGSFVTAEKGLVRIKVHDPAGKLLGVVAGPKDFPEGTVGLDVAADSKGRIMVLDPSTSTVRVYEPSASRMGD